MIGIIPAAGRGTRLGMGCKPLVRFKGNHLIQSAFDNMIALGITEAVIIQGTDEIQNTIGDRYQGLALTYVLQPEPKGIAHAISLAKPFVPEGESMLVILGDIIYDGNDLVQMKQVFDDAGHDCLVGVQEVADKSVIKKSYGVSDDNVFTEKPTDEALLGLKPLLGLGMYMFSPTLFDAIERTPPSALRNEIEITDALNNFEKRSWYTLGGDYRNINTPEDLT